MSSGKQFDELVSIVKQLRGDNGCPWDRKQTHGSLLPYFLEEAYEVMETVDQQDWNTLEEELGDILLHVVFQTRIAEENGEFGLESVLETVNRKLVQRHPHVFGEASASGPFHAKVNWEAAKQQEKGRSSRLEGVPKTLPALVRALRLQQKASYAGFDWERIDQVWEKVQEELEELKDAHARGTREDIEEEVGDLLFALVNVCRFLDISPEDALRKSNEKFTRRFQEMEKELKKQGRSLEQAELETMDRIWNRIKGADKQ
ncbi:MAG: nucleoside triphosphate pyrophosphohydrolase [Fidelibacterota bacterium]